MIDKKEKDKKPDDKHMIAKLSEGWTIAETYYSRDIKKMQLLDAADNGDIWKALRAKFPSYQILPDTNHVAYVKSNLLASLYTTAKSAQIIPTTDDDKEVCMHLNVVLEHLWDTQDVGYYEFLAGERAALLNMGITQIGWSENIIQGVGESFKKGDVSFKNIDPMKFRRDPFATDLETSKWCGYFEEYHKTVFKSNPKYKAAFEEFLKNDGADGPSNSKYYSGPDKNSAKDYYTLYIYWVRQDDGTIDEYHVINNSAILFKKEDIKPSIFPFAILYCNLPSTGLVGVSEPAKIFANSVAYNMLQSIALTAEYKNQRPPKFINSGSGLNITSFAKHGDEADRTFIVNGDASKAVHYHQFPFVSATLPQQMNSLNMNIQDISGVDGRYTGRDTGSIITTGGTEEMLNRVTLVDTPKILAYEKYTKQLTKLVLLNLIEFAPERKYFIKDPQNPGQYKTIGVKFPDIDTKTLFGYSIQISSELPKNKQRVAAFANMIMEKQMQYRKEGQNVDLITEEEWLSMQDVPYKEQMLERMGYQKMTDAYQEAAQVIYQYGNMVDAGMDPQQALMNAAEGLQSKRAGEPPVEVENNMTQTPVDSMSVNDLGV